jgi:PAT family beta-lactamase induction signal transducer AmpG
MGVAIISVLSLAFISSLPLAWIFVALFGVCYGVYQTVYFALAMEYTDPRIAATMFSIMMAVTNIGQGVGMGMTGAFVDTMGFQTTFIIMAAINLAALPFLPLIFGRKKMHMQTS